MCRELTLQQKATLLFALQYLKANFDDAVEAMHDSIFFSRLVGENVRPPGSAGDVQRLLQHLLKDETPAEQVKVAYVLRDDDDLECKAGNTLQDVLDAGGALIDGCVEPPLVAFQVEGDDRWLVASIECVVTEANPELIREWIGDRLDAIESGVGAPPEDTDAAEAEKELTFLRAALAGLPEGGPPPLPPGV